MNNVAAYSLQLGLLVCLAAFVPALLRIRTPETRLAYWQSLLGACLVLPLIRPWTKVAADGVVTVSSFVRKTAPAHRGGLIDIAGILWIALLTGMLFRFAWLGLGLLRLRRYRQRSHVFECGCESASVLVSDEILSPVTFGFLRPVVLLPRGFTELDESAKEAILCHELTHVRRHDWLFTVVEEAVRAVLWFHPAIWWLLGEIQLAREQVVDRAVIRTTGSRDPYVEALLAIAGAGPQLDLPPAPLFLRRRHLKQRVVSILKEVPVSRRKSFPALAAGLGLMAAACWFVTGAIPLTANAAEPQKIRVGGNAAQQNLVSKATPVYPVEAKQAHIQGTVKLEIEVGTDGRVTNISTVEGPPALIQSAVDAVKQWVYRPTLLNGEPVVVQTTVNVNYTLVQ